MEFDSVAVMVLQLELVSALLLVQESVEEFKLVPEWEVALGPPLVPVLELLSGPMMVSMMEHLIAVKLGIGVCNVVGLGVDRLVAGWDEGDGLGLPVSPSVRGVDGCCDGDTVGSSDAAGRLSAKITTFCQ